MQRARQINLGILTEHHSGGIKKPKIRVRDSRSQQPIDKALLAAGHPADDIVDAVWASERSALGVLDMKCMKTMK
jgi:hypothetical protein